MLSKSKYCDGVICEKRLWLDINKPSLKSETNESVLANGTNVGILARDLFKNHVDISFDKNLDNMINDTKKEMCKEKNIICEASFSYDNLFASIDILKKDNNDVYIYEVKSTTEIENIYLYDISFQAYILKKLGYNIKETCIITIDSSYVRKKELDLHKLFKINDVKDHLISDSAIESDIKRLKMVLCEKKEVNANLKNDCLSPYECPFFKYCTKDLPDNNVFTIRQMRKSQKIKLYNDNIYTYEDLLKSDINEKYKMQIDYELNDKKDLINKENIKAFLDTLSYPLYFLDFETFQDAIPKYENVSPYMQIPFQYSLHYYDKNKKLHHKEFLADANNDPRRLLAESLISDIPKDVCTLAYNMSFEKSVIKHLSEIYPDLKDHLLNIYNNIHDLMIPFYNKDYYTKNMHGSYSIKYVLPALFPKEEELDYHNLDMIHNGSEAMNAFANMENLNEKEVEIVRENLLKYCKLDTYAMVKIYDKLKEII